MKVISLPSPLPPAGLGSAAALRALAAAFPHGVVTTDADGIVTYWSEEATRITGWTPDETLGKPCAQFLGDSRPPSGPGSAQDGPDRGSSFSSIRARDGRELRILRNAVPLTGEHGAALGTLQTFTEVELPVAPAPLVRAPEPRPGSDADASELLGRHPAMRELRQTIERAARSDAAVMILGESGTGKDLVARAIHRLGPRASRPFVRVSCALLEGDPTALFGSAYSDRRGRIDEASGGTLFLDEIGDLPPQDQAHLLRFLEQRATAEPAKGAPENDVRLLCSSCRDVRQLVAERRLRADLYFRLAVLPLHVPAVRDHAEDVPELAGALLARRGSRATLSPAALAALQAYAWPGNVRELENLLAYAVLMVGDGEIRPEHLPVYVAAATGTAARAEPVRTERARTLKALAASEWNRTRAAAMLGISRVTLWKRIRRLGLIPGAPESDPDDA